MHKIKEKMMEELKEIEKHLERSDGSMSMQDIDKIYKMVEIVKGICKIDALEEGGGYSEGGHYMGEGRIYGTSYDDDYSMARGRGRNARRDRMGRYSRDGGSYDGGSYDGSSYDDYSMDDGNSMRRGRRGYSRDEAKDMLIEKAEKLMPMAQDEESKKALKRFIQQLEQG